jgi:hypothetical protein
MIFESSVISLGQTIHSTNQIKLRFISCVSVPLCVAQEHFVLGLIVHQSPQTKCSLRMDLCPSTWHHAC